MAKKRVCRGEVKVVDPVFQSEYADLLWAGAGSGSPGITLGQVGQAGPSTSLRSAQDDELRSYELRSPELEVVNPPVPFGTRTGHTGSVAVDTGFGAGEVVKPMSQKRDVEHPVQLEAVNPPVPFGTRTGHTASVVLRKSPRPSGCSRFVRREIADAMPSICAMLLTRVMDGDLASLKLLLQMAADGQSAEREGAGRAAGFGRKVLVGFKDWEARETGLRRES